MMWSANKEEFGEMGLDGDVETNQTGDLMNYETDEFADDSSAHSEGIEESQSEQPSTDKSSKSSSGSKTVLIVVILAVLAAGAAGAFFMMPGGQQQAETQVSAMPQPPQISQNTAAADENSVQDVTYSGGLLNAVAQQGRAELETASSADLDMVDIDPFSPAIKAEFRQSQSAQTDTAADSSNGSDASGADEVLDVEALLARYRVEDDAESDNQATDAQENVQNPQIPENRTMPEKIGNVEVSDLSVLPAANTPAPLEVMSVELAPGVTTPSSNIAQDDAETVGMGMSNLLADEQVGADNNGGDAMMDDAREMPGEDASMAGSGQQASQGTMQEEMRYSPEAQAEITQLKQQIEMLQGSLQDMAMRMDQAMQMIEGRFGRLEDDLTAAKSNAASASAQASAPQPPAKPKTDASDEAIVRRQDATQDSEGKANESSAASSAAKTDSVTSSAPAGRRTTATTAKASTPKKTKSSGVRKWTLRSAMPGSAMISDQATGDLRGVSVGERVPGLGTITSIDVVDGKWKVIGQYGTVSQ